jgi:hypothetical protein
VLLLRSKKTLRNISTAPQGMLGAVCSTTHTHKGFQMKPFVLDKQGKMITDFTEGQLSFFAGWSPTSFPKEKDVQESLRVSRRIKAAVGQCWFNARKAIRRMDDYADASYVEGWTIFFGGVAMEHGWIVKDNKIIDPTMPAYDGLYFPGLELRDEQRSTISWTPRQVRSARNRRSFTLLAGAACKVLASAKHGINARRH